MSETSTDYVNYLIAAAIVRRKSSVLLVAMRTSSGGLCWSLPAGKVEGLDSVINTLARELREETGLIVERISQHVCSVHFSRESHQDRTSAFIFEVEASGSLDTSDPDDEVEDAQFFDLDEAIQRLDAHPMRVMVEPAIAYLKGQQPPGAFWSFTSDSAGFLTSHVIQSASEPAALR